MSAAVFSLFLLIGLLFTAGLYIAIETETSNTQVMDRAEAQRQAQRSDRPVRSRQRGDGAGQQEDGATEPDDEHWGDSQLDDDET